MADRQVVIQIDYKLPNAETTSKSLGDVTRKLNDQRQSNKDLKKELKELNDAYNRGEVSAKQYEQQTAKLNQDIAEGEAKTKKLAKEKRILTNQFNAADGSAAGYRARLSQLHNEMEGVNQNTEEGRARLAELKEEYDKIRHQVNAYDEAQGRHQHNVGNYQSALEGVRGSVLAIGAAIGAGIAAFNSLSSAMSESIAAFQEQEQAEAQLAFVAGDATDALLEQASALQRTTTFGDEATIASQQLLLSFGATADQVQNLIPLIQDYAAAQGVDLATATNKINNVLNGESTELRGLKLELSTTSDQTERYSEIKNALNQFSGQAANLAQTESGQLQQLQNRYGDLQEELGERLLPIQLRMTEAKLKLLEAVIKLTSGEGKLFETLQTVGKAMGVVTVAGLAMVAMSTASAAATARDTIAKTLNLAALRKWIAGTWLGVAAQTALNLVMGLNPIGRVITLVAALVAGYLLFRDKLKGVIDVNETFNKIVEVGAKVLSFYLGLYEKGFDLLANFAEKLGLKGVAGALEKVSGAFNIASKATGNYAEKSAEGRAEDKAAAQAKREALEATIAYAEGLESLTTVSQSRVRASREKTFATREEAKAEEELLLQQRQRLATELRLAEVELARIQANGGFNMETFAAAELQQQITQMRLTLSATEDAVLAVREWKPASDAAVGGIEATTEALEDQNEALEDRRAILLRTEDEVINKKIIETFSQASEDLQKEIGTALNPFGEMEADAQKVIVPMDLATQKANELGQKVAKVELGFKMAGEAAGVMFDGIDQRFQNQRNQIEQTAIEEREQIENSTLSEEQKRIRIERAEQKKQLELDKIDRKERKTQKARDIVQSIINTALGITRALTNPLTAGFMVPFIAATGAAQTAIIAAQQFAEGGIAEGPSHAQGGIPITVAGVGGYEMEGGEAIINRKSTAAFAPILSAINSYNGFGKRFQRGGLVGSPDTAFLQPGGGIEGTVRRMADSMQRLKVVNVLTEQNSAQNLLQNSLNEGSF